jgi:peptidoglycan/LPS O-acetylase OafA/YrhL
VLWSLSVEEVFYLMFPVLGKMFRRSALLVSLFVGLIVLGPAYRAAHQGDDALYLYFYIACFDSIAFGCITALAKEHWQPCGITAQVVRLGAGIFVTCVYFAGPIAETNVWGVTAIAFGTSLLLLAWHWPTEQSNLVVATRSLYIGWMGRLCYELYLFHLVILGLLRWKIPSYSVPGNQKLILLVVYLVLSGALAAAFALFYSGPLNRLIRRHWSSSE